MPTTFDVAIIGYGPTGATLAAMLGMRGLQVALFDKFREIYPKPRAVAMDHEAMRVLQRIGVAESVAAKSRDYPSTVYIGAEGSVIQEIVPMPAPHPLSWPPASTFDQPSFEASLRARVDADKNIKVFLEHEVFETTEAPDRIDLAVRTSLGITHRVAAKFVVACDGAQSPTRRRAGLSMESLQFEESWLVVDAIVNDDHIDNLPATNVQYCDPRRPSTYVVCPGRHRRWEFKVMPGEHFEEPIPIDHLYRLLDRWLSPANSEIWRAAAYQFKAVVAERWRHGRIFLAGDAAHQMPPFLGQGMCQGIRDAANLEWKLARVLHSQSSDKLLDTYQVERKAHVTEVTQVVVKLGSVIGELQIEKARARDKSILAEQGGTVKPKVRQSLIPGISGGQLLHGSQGSGQWFPQPFVSHDGRLVRADELTGPRAMLVCSVAPEGQMARELLALLKEVGGVVVALGVDPSKALEGVLHLQESEQMLSNWFAKHESAVALVRPDHYVYGTAREIGQAANLVRAFLDGLQCPTLAQEKTP